MPLSGFLLPVEKCLKQAYGGLSYARRERFDQLRSSGNTGLEGTINDAGRHRLVHYSPRPIERVDPNEYGKGLSGRTC